MRKLKEICIVSPFPPPTGGVSLQAKILSEYLTKEGVRVYKVNTSPSEKFFARPQIIRFFMVLFRFFKNASGCPVINIYSCSHRWFFFLTCPIMILSKLLRKKVILTFKGGRAKKFFDSYKFARLFLKMPDRFLVPSNYLKEVFRDIGFDVQVFPNIIQDGIMSPEVKRLNKSCPNIIMTRHLMEIYDIATAIRAFKLVVNKIPGARLNIAGTGPQEESLKKLVQAENIANISFLGGLQPEELWNVYELSHLFLNTSIIDNSPNAIIEAFHHGLPIVTTDAGGIPYMIRNEDNGLLVSCKNFVEIANAVIRVLTDPELYDRLAMNSRKEALKYSWERNRERWFELVRF